MANPNILVVGDLMIDHYIWGNCNRISPEAPVAVINVENETNNLGGAGNVVANLKALGSNVGIISVIGNDETGNLIEKFLKDLDTRNYLIKQDNRKSSKKTRIMASNQQVIRVDKESIENIICEDELINKFENIVDDFDVILLSDYGKGVLTSKVCENLIKLSHRYNKQVLVDPKGKDYCKYKGATFLTPNKKEASEATNIQINNKISLETAIKKLKNEFNLTYSIITMSEDGIAFFDDNLKIFPALAKEVYDVTGAGDSVLATLGYCIAKKYSIEEAIKMANLAAAVVVGKVGSASATLEEIEAISKSKFDFSKKIIDISQIKSIFQNRKKEKIVFTNGCFDILHFGHIKYLQTAKNFGDILIIGLNSDDSVKRLKGKDRPVNNQFDRASLLAALEFVDFVVIFDEDTPKNLISLIKPDILVKGADYKGKEVVGSDIVKDVRLVEFIDGKSTTNLINKIKG